jgi:hypothetical protein
VAGESNHTYIRNINTAEQSPAAGVTFVTVRLSAGRLGYQPPVMRSASSELQETVEELQATVAKLTQQLKEQAAQIQKMNAQLEASKAAPQVVSNPLKPVGVGGCVSSFDLAGRTIGIADAHRVKSVCGVDPASGTWSATGSCCATFYPSRSQACSCNSVIFAVSGISRDNSPRGYLNRGNICARSSAG